MLLSANSRSRANGRLLLHPRTNQRAEENDGRTNKKLRCRSRSPLGACFQLTTRRPRKVALLISLSWWWFPLRVGGRGSIYLASTRHFHRTPRPFSFRVCRKDNTPKPNILVKKEYSRTEYRTVRRGMFWSMVVEIVVDRNVRSRSVISELFVFAYCFCKENLDCASVSRTMVSLFHLQTKPGDTICCGAIGTTSKRSCTSAITEDGRFHILRHEEEGAPGERGDGGD